MCAGDLEVHAAQGRAGGERPVVRLVPAIERVPRRSQAVGAVAPPGGWRSPCDLGGDGTRLSPDRVMRTDARRQDGRRPGE